MSGTGAQTGRGLGICKWLLVLGICSIVPGTMLRNTLSNVDRWQLWGQQAEQRTALKVAEYLALTRRLVAVVGEELRRIEAAVESGSPLQRRLVELQQDQQVCLARLTGGAVSASDNEFSQLLRRLTELRSTESGELRILREELQSVREELRGLAGGAEQAAVNQVCEAVDRLQAEWAQRLSPAAAGELKLAAGSVLVRCLELRQRLSSPEVPDEDLPARAGGLVLAEQAIVEQSEVLQRRRQEATEQREQRLRQAEHLQCVQLELQQQRERLQRLRGDLAEVQRRRESADGQWQQRQQLERAAAAARGEVDRESELLRLATELLRQEILAGSADRVMREEL